MSKQSEELGSKPIGALLAKQAIPASVGILIMSIYMIVDTIFVGHYVGSLGISAITVVSPITFLIASFGMAIGIGGASMISRAMGANQEEKAFQTFGNQATLTVIIASCIVFAGSFFQEEVLILFGGKGNILPFAKEYFQIILYGIPFLAWAMMSTSVIRSVGAPKVAMMVMIIPAVLNVIFDAVLIVYLDWGIEGAAWATTISYFCTALFATFFFFSKQSELKLKLKNLVLRLVIVQEIFSIGIVTLARQGTISILYIFLNNALYTFGGELSVAVYGIINRIMMFSNFPILGISQGYMPIAGYNYGAKNWKRVRTVLNLAIRSGTAIALVLFIGVLIFSEQIVAIFTKDQELIAMTGSALMKVFIATPLIAVQLIGSAYFQVVGKAIPALLLTLTKQGFFLVPLILILPRFYGLDGIWYAFPIADVGAAAITYYFLRKETANIRGLE
jgi:putative MATE family efflux protein